MTSRAHHVRNAAILVIAGVLATILALGLVTVVSMPWIVGCFGMPDRFDQAAWIAADPTDTCSARRDMGPDLLQRHLHVGMPRAEVRALLGGADAESDDGDGPVARYFLGCLIDCDHLAIRYDVDGAVSEVWLGQD